mgnify:FL=1
MNSMKVQGPGKTQAPSKTKKKDKASGADGSFGDFVASAPQKSAPAKQSQSITNVDALLAIQAAEDPTAGKSRRKMQQRANTILDELEDLRMAMLNGTMTVGHMINIADVVAEHRENVHDPSLTALMDEIDLRAQVELAKMRVVLDKKSSS